MESDTPVACLALQGITNRRADFLLSAVAAADPDSSAPLRVLPQVAVGGGYATDLVLLSTKDTTLQALVRWFTSAAQPWLLPVSW